MRRRRSQWIAGAFIASALSVSACYHPLLGNFRCGDADACPTSFFCGEDGYCRQQSDGAPYFGTGEIQDKGVFAESDGGRLKFNTETGRITLVITDPQGNDNEIQVVDGKLGFRRVKQQVGGPTLAVWNFVNFSIPQNMTIIPESQSRSVIVIAATESLTIDGGSVDWRGYGGSGGGVNADGEHALDPKEKRIPVGGVGLGTPDPGSGGGGGGWGSDGQSGEGPSPGAGGASFGVTDLLPSNNSPGGGTIFSGPGGGRGGASDAEQGGWGGTGGGAVALLSRSITLTNATIDVSGERGLSSVLTTAPAGGGGGGAGGTILVSASNLSITGSTLRALGGAGGLGNNRPGAFNGGKGGNGRIWLGGDTKTLNNLTSEPAYVPNGKPLSIFPP